jgi:hypothetical protein
VLGCSLEPFEGDDILSDDDLSWRSLLDDMSTTIRLVSSLSHKFVNELTVDRAVL